MINPKLQNEETDRLCDAMLALQSREECYQFLEDICTVNELRSMAQRLEVARMLQADCTYEEIVAKTGASTATVSRVKRCLNYGADGYVIALERLKK